MKIWTAEANVFGRHCFDKYNDLETKRKIYDFYEKEYINNWDPVNVSFISNTKRTDKLHIENITLFSNKDYTFICDQYAKDTLINRFSQLQFLPVIPIEEDIAKQNNFYLINVLKRFDGFNYENCKFEFSLGEHIFDIIKYNIKEEAIQYPIFNLSIKGEPFRKIYATDEFKDYVEEKGLTGFVFTEVFDFENKKE